MVPVIKNVNYQYNASIYSVLSPTILIQLLIYISIHFNSINYLQNTSIAHNSTNHYPPNTSIINRTTSQYNHQFNNYQSQQDISSHQHQNNNHSSHHKQHVINNTVVQSYLIAIFYRIRTSRQDVESR